MREWVRSGVNDEVEWVKTYNKGEARVREGVRERGLGQEWVREGMKA